MIWVQDNKIWHTGSIHVQYTETESIRLKHFTIRLDSHVASWLDSHGAHLSQIDFRHDESTTRETIRVDSIESSRIDNIFNPPCIAHQKSRSVK